MSELRAWHGDPGLKVEVVARMKKHRQLDEIIQGAYQAPHSMDRLTGGFKGCAVGCTLPQMFSYNRNLRMGLDQTWLRPEDQEIYNNEGWHGLVQQYYGIDSQVAAAIDDTFEEQMSFEAAAKFAVDVIEVIPVGADLSKVAEQFDELYDARADETRDEYGPNWQTEMSEWMATTLIGLLSEAPVPLTWERVAS